MATNEAATEIPTEISQLPDEILFEMFLRLSLPEVSRCMQVCKRYCNLITPQEFWRKYLKANYSLTPLDNDAPQYKSLTQYNLDLLMKEWFCYWDDSYEIVEENDPTRYVFRPFPQMWDNGIMTPGNFEPFAENVEYDYYALNKAIHLLLKLQQKCEDFEITSTPYYSTMDSVPNVCLFPWPSDKLPKPSDVLKVFHVHEEIIKKADEHDEINVSDKLDHYSEYPDYDVHITSLDNTFSIIKKNEEDAEELFKWLQIFFQPSLMFCAGVDSVYPQLYFHLTILSSGWVGGVFAPIGLV